MMDAVKDPKLLLLIVCDEAHSGATGKVDNKQLQETPYSKLVNPWNSQDFPNVVVIMVTATPWTLLTINSKLSSIVLGFNTETEDYHIFPNDDRRNMPNGIVCKTFPLHHVRWINAMTGNFENGHKLKLVVFVNPSSDLESGSAFRLNFDYQGFHGTPVVAGNEDHPGASWIIKGQIHGIVKISSIISWHDEEIELFWTVDHEHDDTIVVEKEHQDASNQSFVMETNFGEDLLAFHPVKNLNKWVEFHHELGHLRLSSLSRRGQLNTVPNCPNAPLVSTFMCWPEEKDKDFYLSLNHIVNSTRFSSRSDQRLRKDDTFCDIFKNIQEMTNNSSAREDTLIASYAFFILIFSLIKSLTVQSVASVEVEEIIMEIKEKHSEFEKLLDPENEHNKVHKPIQAEFYQHFLKCLNDNLTEEALSTDPAAEPDTYSAIIILNCIVSVCLEKDRCKIKKMFTRLKRDCRRPIGNAMFEQFDLASMILQLLPTGQVIQDCLTPVSNDLPSSGHMALIRAKSISCGNRMKQTFCLARKVSQLYTLEFIQDYGIKTTLKDHLGNLCKDAELLRDRACLRIWQRIQVDKCQYTKDGIGCECTCNRQHTGDGYTLTCQDCHHIHKRIWNYEDLDKLPCIVILVDNARMGDTFPKSLIVMDLRLSNYDKKRTKQFKLQVFVQELGRLCRYTQLCQRLPYALIGNGLYHQLEFSLKTDASFYNSFVPGNVDDKIKYDDTKKQFLPKETSADFKTDQNKPRNNHFLLHADPQSGKTGVFLYLICLFRRYIEAGFKMEELELDAEDEFGELEDEENDETTMQVVTYDQVDIFDATFPFWKLIEALPALPMIVSVSKYLRLAGHYHYPPQCPPNVPDMSKPGKKKKVFKEPKHDKCTHDISHADTKCCVQRRIVKCTLQLPITDNDIRISYPDLSHYKAFFVNKNPDAVNMIHIMTPSHNRALSARLNWNHLMEDKLYLHMVFVRSSQFSSYVAYWGNMIAVIELPETMTDISETVYNGGVGFARRFIQHFAHHHKLDRFWMADDNIIYIKECAVSDLNQIVDNGNGLEMVPTTLWKIHETFKRIGSREENVPATKGVFECLQEFDGETNKRLIAAFTGPFEDFGILGMRKMRPSHNKFKEMFAKKHLSSLMFINNDALMRHNILFKPWPVWEDLNICNDCEAAKLTVLKLYCYEFAKVSSHNKDLLYTWTDDDQVPEDFYPSTNREIIKLLHRFLKGLRFKHINFEVSQMSHIMPKMYDICSNLTRCDSLTNICFVNFNVIETLLMSFNSNLNLKVAEVYYFLDMTELYFVGIKTIQDLRTLIESQTSKPFEMVVSSTHKPRVANDVVVVQIRFKEQTMEEDGQDYPDRVSEALDDPEPMDDDNSDSMELEDIVHQHGDDVVQECEEAVPELVDEPSSPSDFVKIDLHGRHMPTEEEKIFLETNVVQIKDLPAKYEEGRHKRIPRIVVNVVSKMWTSRRGVKKRSFWVENPDGYKETILFDWPRDPCLSLGMIQPNRIYEILNCKIHLYQTPETRAPYQIEVNQESVVRPIPDHLNIALTFNKSPDKWHVDIIAKVIKIKIVRKPFEKIQFVLKDLNTGQKHDLICENPDEEDKVQAQNLIGVDIVVRNGFVNFNDHAMFYKSFPAIVCLDQINNDQ